MTSNDRYVTGEMFDTRTGQLEAQIKQLGERQESSFRELKQEIQAVNYNVLMNAQRINDMHSFIGWGFAIIAIVVAFVAFMLTLAPMFRDMYRDIRKPILTEERVQELIDNAVSRALRQSGK